MTQVTSPASGSIVMTALPCAPVFTTAGASEPPERTATNVCLRLCACGDVVAPTTRSAVINPYRNVLRMEILLTVNWAFTGAGRRRFADFGRRATTPVLRTIA